MNGCCVCGYCGKVNGEDGGVVAMGRKRNMCLNLFTSRAYFKCKRKVTDIESEVTQNDSFIGDSGNSDT